eukprot:CAMPEP_0171656704 /NCGR_PEP_ID=MMETSP0990-20121206/41774_1 /TAXON_ID=483369 /ORGANISM="non described non described, Strain CCMP2098" /LENGTH=36 /DNA_ID= /DNA_START= /DNA_END= /DNA_ORIENTATION=
MAVASVIGGKVGKAGVAGWRKRKKHVLVEEGGVEEG